MSDLKVEFRAQRTLLQALHDTQQEHSATFREHGAILAEQGAILGDHTRRLSRLESGQHRIMAGVDAIREMLDRALSGGND